MQKNFLKIASLKLGDDNSPANCRIRASNDVEAVERFLEEYINNPKTFRAYKKEAERFLVWCIKKQSTNFSNLTRDDAICYIEFIRDPQPRDVWCGPRYKKYGDNSNWYPFAGPLGESSIKTALSCLSSLMSYLVDARYIDFNPFALIRKKSRIFNNLDEQRIIIQERILSDSEWQAILKVINEKPDQIRSKMIIILLYFLGIRVHELANARWSDFKKINNKWWFFVQGKGGRLGKVPVNLYLLQEIMEYRYSINLAPLPNQEDLPVIVSSNNQKRGICVRQLSNLVKEVGLKAALKFDKDSISYKKLEKFSPHWLRHLSASRQDLAGISFTNIKSNLRHQNEQTTRIYVHSHDDVRHAEMDKLKLTD